MKLKLSDWASIAEVIASVAVVITLVVLVVGIEENTNITRAAVYQESLDRLNEFERFVVQDEELTGIWDTVFRGEVAQLQGLDRARLNSLARQYFRIFESAYYDRQYDLVTDVAWARFERSMCGAYGIAKAQELRGTIEAIITVDFLEYLDTACPSKS